MKVMVTGGAGYIGSVVTEYLISGGNEVIVVDDLSTGHREAVSGECEFVELNLLETGKLTEVMKRGVDSVCHFAAFSLVSESMENPLKYYHNNICGAVSLVEAMKEAGVEYILFSSTAAVYGEPEVIPVSENSSLEPVNPYGNSKLAIEKILEDSCGAYGISSMFLRYFNAAGASDLHGEDHRPESHLIPIILDAAEGKREQLVVYGNDYPTEDGTCIRDYIHVRDLAAAHVLGLEKLAQGITGAFNLGSGKGFSVLEVIDAAERVTGKKVPYRIGDRREGDPAVLIASSRKAEDILGWERSFGDIETIIEDAYNWRREFPTGYRE